MSLSPKKSSNVYLRRSATEAQLGWAVEHELQFALESKLEFAFEFESEAEFEFALEGEVEIGIVYEIGFEFELVLEIQMHVIRFPCTGGGERGSSAAHTVSNAIQVTRCNSNSRS